MNLNFSIFLSMCQKKYKQGCKFNFDYTLKFFFVCFTAINLHYLNYDILVCI